jgi:hypothetical protein
MHPLLPLIHPIVLNLSIFCKICKIDTRFAVNHKKIIIIIKLDLTDGIMYVSFGIL